MRHTPFFSYFGGKTRAAVHYPPPIHDLIVEPFAGAAGYATLHREKKVILVEKDPIIAEVWRYLIGSTEDDILSLPDIHPDQSTADLDVPAGARGLIGFWINLGTTSPRKHPSSRFKSGQKGSSHWGPERRQVLAGMVGTIKHWEIIEASYELIDAGTATYFIDPPYQASGHHYRHSKIDYPGLGEWCRSRSGQVMVCEADGADWLPFKPFRELQAMTLRSGQARTSREVIWTNEGMT